MGDSVRYETSLRVATLTLHRPERLNAIVPELIEDLETALDRAESDADVRALESLGVTGRTSYPVAFWLAYVDACRALAARHAVSLRALDKALWQASKERSGEML